MKFGMHTPINIPYLVIGVGKNRITHENDRFPDGHPETQQWWQRQPDIQADLGHRNSEKPPGDPGGAFGR